MIDKPVWILWEKIKNLFFNLPVAELAQAHPINYFDVGSRGGFQDDLFPIAFSVNAVGFEPEAVALEELRRKKVQPWRTVNFLPFGISGKGGLRNLYITKDETFIDNINSQNQKKYLKPKYFTFSKILSSDFKEKILKKIK